MHPGSGGGREFWSNRRQRRVSVRVSSGSHVDDVPPAESSSVDRNASSRMGGVSERRGSIFRAFLGRFSRHSTTQAPTDSEKPRETRKGKGRDASPVQGLCCIPSSRGGRRESSGTTTTGLLGSKTDTGSSDATCSSKSAASSSEKSMDSRKEESDDLADALLAAAYGNGIPLLVPGSFPRDSSSFILVPGSFPGYSSSPSMGVIAARTQGISFHSSSDTLRALRRLYNAVKNFAADICDEGDITSTQGLCCIPSSQGKRRVSSEAKTVALLNSKISPKSRSSTRSNRYTSGSEKSVYYKKYVPFSARSAEFEAFVCDIPTDLLRGRYSSTTQSDSASLSEEVESGNERSDTLLEKHVRALESAVLSALESLELGRLHSAHLATRNYLVRALLPLLELAKTETEKSDSQPTKHMTAIENIITQIGDCLTVMQSSQKEHAAH
ncbi:hypothetical protein, partial [Anaplasma phagocytophilum]|uniref:hypothetical protein n=1 Tax=Anaplasma phagocytophilum TaxID=948 RepID=UPI00201A8A07